eukprot:GILK01015867.1.p1 GENE.GILK01015867.1~~GILK01015867.1.p1  ORF type:complete len:411 (+),score=40.23 GILK01015867.1:181-1233(+)
MASREWPATPLLASGRGGLEQRYLAIQLLANGYWDSSVFLEMRPSIPLLGPQTIKIGNLVGIRVDPSEPLAGPAATMFAMDWSDADDTLTLTLLPMQTMPSDSDTVVTLNFHNPVRKQGEVTYSIQLNNDPMQDCYASWQVLNVFRNQYFAYDPSGLTAIEDNPVPGAANRVKLSVRPQVSDFVANMDLSLLFTPPLNIPSGMTNLNPSSDASPVPVAATGNYDRLSGILTVPIIRPVNTTTTISVTIDFTNPSGNDFGFAVQLTDIGPLSYYLYGVGGLGTGSAAFKAVEMLGTVRTASATNKSVFRLRPVYNIPFATMEIGPFPWVTSVTNGAAPGASHLKKRQNESL